MRYGKRQRAFALSVKGLVIRLQLVNTSAGQFLDYPSWGSFGEIPRASLMDDLGNSYRQLATGESEYFDRALTNRLRPGETSQDILVFEEVLPAAKVFFLEIPGPDATILDAKPIRVRIPRSSVRVYEPRDMELYHP